MQSSKLTHSKNRFANFEDNVPKYSSVDVLLQTGLRGPVEPLFRSFGEEN